MLKKLALTAVALSAPSLALTLGAERVLRPRLFYNGGWHPDPPDVLGLTYEEAHIFTADGLELQGWYFPAGRIGGRSTAVATEARPTILFMHGTSYNASDMWVTEERSTAFADFLTGIRANFLIFDYRGYGKSPGTPSEENTYTDAAAALAWLYDHDAVDPATVFSYGFSLGTGIATGLAMREPSAGLILRAPFTSIRGMIADWFPRSRPLLAAAPWLPLTNYDTLSKIRRLDRPLLVMHGEADRTVPEYMGQQIFEAAPEPKTYVSFPDTGHSDIANEMVVPAVTTFIDRVLASREAVAAAESAAG